MDCSPNRVERHCFVKRGLSSHFHPCGDGETLLKVTSHTAKNTGSPLLLSFPGLSAGSKGSITLQNLIKN